MGSKRKREGIQKILIFLNPSQKGDQHPYALFGLQEGILGNFD